MAIDFPKAVSQLIRPKAAPFYGLLSFTVLLFVTALLSGRYSAMTAILSGPITTIFAGGGRSNATHSASSSTRAVPSPAKNESAATITDVSLLKNYGRSNGTGATGGTGAGDGGGESMVSVSGPRRRPRVCDIFDGRWVVDEAGPAYGPGSCPFIDTAFNCFQNGRVDLNYTKLRWQPKGCRIPRLDGERMLGMLRGKRLAFVGDSLNRNMWQSLVCMLRSSVRNKEKVFEISGRREFRTEGSYSVKFDEYNCTIEFFRSPFLVQEWQASNSEGGSKETLRLDVVHESSKRYKDADVIIFNTAHWWTHEKTSLGRDFYQEGEHVYSQLSAAEAYRKALTTWGKWVDANINISQTQVFFRGYSSSHFRGGQWNSGGNCDGETLPITNDAQLEKYPKMMAIFESVMMQVETPVRYMNITKMTDYRKDAHPSIFRQPPAERKPGTLQDCSHWCLPGVPDSWNELLYAMLLKSSKEKTRIPR